MTTRYNQAMQGLTLHTVGEGVAWLDDGHCHWAVDRDEWDRAAVELSEEPPLDGDDAEAEAYGQLCRRVARYASAILSTDGGQGTSEARRALMARSRGQLPECLHAAAAA